MYEDHVRRQLVRDSLKSARRRKFPLILGVCVFSVSLLVLGAFTVTHAATRDEQLEYIRTEALSIQAQLDVLQRETLMEKIDRYANAYNIPKEKLHALVFCESSYNPKARNLSKVEDSRGIAQINRLVHDVTVAQAEDPDFSLQFVIKNWDKRHSMWKVCSRKHDL